MLGCDQGLAKIIDRGIYILLRKLKEVNAHAHGIIYYIYIVLGVGLNTIMPAHMLASMCAGSIN